MKRYFAMAGDIILVISAYAVVLTTICAFIYGMIAYWWVVMGI